MIGAFDTGRTRLRAIEPSDWEAFARWEADSDRSGMQYFTPWPKSEETWREWASRSSDEEPGAIDGEDTQRFVIADGDGAPIGQMVVFSTDRRRGTFSYGMGVGKEHGGKGHGREAVVMLLGFYFLELRYQKCEITVDETNAPSLALHEGLGFQREGTLRSVYYTRGARSDEICLGLTIDEFVAGR